MKKGKKINLFVDDGEERNPNDSKLYNKPSKRNRPKGTMTVICGRCNKSYEVNELLLAGKDSYTCDICLTRNRRG